MRMCWLVRSGPRTPLLAALMLACSVLGAGSLAQAPGQAATAPAPSPGWPLYQSTGEQYRVYEFPGTGEPVPYRLSVPPSWAPGQHLPVLVTLRAGTSINNNHRGGNDLVREANARGYIVISPLGYRGHAQPYYGSPYPVDRPGGPSTPAAGWTDEENLRAEQDVLNVLDIVAAEYGADTSRVYLHGQNPSGSAAFHFAAKYPERFRAIVVSSGPIITRDYPFEVLKDKVAVLLLHGDQDSSNAAAASQRVAQELLEHGIDAEFRLVPGGEHLDAYLRDAAGLFDFLDRH
jgi:dienelactone hydrolase